MTKALESREIRAFYSMLNDRGNCSLSRYDCFLRRIKSVKIFQYACFALIIVASFASFSPLSLTAKATLSDSLLSDSGYQTNQTTLSAEKDFNFDDEFNETLWEKIQDNTSALMAYVRIMAKKQRKSVAQYLNEHKKQIIIGSTVTTAALLATGLILASQKRTGSFARA